MTEPFTFTGNRIDDHTQKIGVDIRPVIEHKLDREKLFEFSKQLIDKYPNLYESLVQSPTDFHIRKKFIFAGKGEIDLVTLGVPQRGPVFIFPRRLSLFDEDLEFESLENIVLDGLKIFRKAFPGKTTIRVGLVNEYIFDTGLLDSTKLICDRFTKVSVPSHGQVKLFVNLRTDDYNVRIELEAVRKLEAIPEIPGRQQTSKYGVKVSVDFNNRDASQDLDQGKILSILHDAQEYNRTRLYDFLNSP